MATFQRRPSNDSGGWIQTALSWLERISVILLALLGPMIAPPKSHSFPYNNHNTGDQSHSFFSNSSGAADVELREAYQFFGLDRGKCTQDDLNKQWKRLSRKHHPDRNHQSRESVEMTQKMNHYKELILKHDFALEEEEDNNNNNKEREEREEQHDDGAQDCGCARDSYGAEEDDCFEPRSAKQKKKKRGQKAGYHQWKKNRKQKQKRNNWHPRNNDNFFHDDYDHHHESYYEEQAEYENSSDEMKEFVHNMKNVEQEQEKIEIGLRALHTGLKRDIQKDKQNGDLYHQHQGIDTYTQEGRDKAHWIWLQSQKSTTRSDKDSDHEVPPSTRASSSSLDDIDDEDDEDNVSNTGSDHDNTKKPAASPNPDDPKADDPPKPINLTMEQCTDKIVIALRLGFHDTAADLLNTICLRASDHSVDTTGDGGNVYKIIQEVLEQPLDYDENTWWHYAAYYESDRLLSSLLATYSHVIEANEDSSKLFHPPEPLAMMLKENARGQIPQDFLRCAPGSYMDQRVRNLTDAAHAARKENTLEHRFLSLLKNVDVFAILYSCGMYLVVCRYFFGCGRPLSFLVCFAQSKMMVDEPRERIIYTMMVLGIYRVSIRPCLGWIRFFFWTTWTNLFVSLIAVYILKKLKAMKYVFSIAAWINLAMFQFVGLRIAHFSDRLDAVLLRKLTRSNKWLASNPNVNGLFYLVIYCSLFFGAQWSIQHILTIAYTSVFGKNVMDGAMGFSDHIPSAPETEEATEALSNLLPRGKRIPSIKEFENMQV